MRRGGRKRRIIEQWLIQKPTLVLLSLTHLKFQLLCSQGWRPKRERSRLYQCNLCGKKTTGVRENRLRSALKSTLRMVNVISRKLWNTRNTDELGVKVDQWFGQTVIHQWDSFTFSLWVHWSLGQTGQVHLEKENNRLLVSKDVVYCQIIKGTLVV